MQCRFCRLSLNNHGGSEGMGVQVRIDAGLAARSSPGVYAKRGDYSHSVKLKISGATESFVACLLADLPHLVAGGIVGSMTLSRTQQQADLFQAAGAQEACRTRTPARLTSAQQSAAVVSAAEKLSLRHILPRDLSNALKQLDDGELDRLLEAIGYELQRRGRSLTSTLVIRPTTQMSTEQRASDQLTTTEKSPERRQPEEPNVALTQGQVNAVRATFKAGITPSRIARQFGISQSDVRKVLTSESRRSGKSK
jgi:hypothetical protein